MADAPVSGPARPRRHDVNLADRIVALQRKNATTVPLTGIGAARSSRRGGQNDKDEFSRGTERLPPGRTLFDPSKPTPPPSLPQTPPQYSTPLAGPSITGLHLSPHRNGSNGGEERRRRPPPPPPPSRGEASVKKKLFNPDIHDPLRFHPSSQSSLLPPPPPESAAGPSRPLLRRPLNGRTPEEEADRERERRRRREGSERGSGSTNSKKKDSSDSKSKGSRSSDGSESFKDRERGKGKGDSGVKAILKDIHNKIRTLEGELTEMHRKMQLDPEAGISVLLDKPPNTYARGSTAAEDDDCAAWMDLIGKHKELADLHHLFLVRVFDPLVPSTFQQLAVKYNIPSRLWQTSFHLILERLRHAWLTSHPAALDLLTDLVYDAYKFYTDLLEDVALSNFRTAWIEALGDLARYRMAMASHVGESSRSAQGQGQGQLERVLDEDEADRDSPIDGGASIGAEVAQSWDVEDQETWRTTARDWYTMGITEKPGEGRLHHHLALLSREVRGQEGRALHHFTKSLIVTHQYGTSRESLLPLFASPLQSQRTLPEATAMDLFVRLHGMLFTKIDLDNFPSIMSRFMERLEEDARLDGVSRKATVTQVDWIIMGSVNIAAVLQYGASSGVIRKALSLESAERRKAHATNGEGEGEQQEVQDVEGEDPTATHSEDEAATNAVVDEPPQITPTFTYALELTFAVLQFTLQHPTRQQGLQCVLNPYIPVLLTFLATLSRQPHVASILTADIPWNALLAFANASNLDIREESRLTTGPPLPEDWALRGMEWVGRRVYERGFWKAKSSSRGSGAMATPQPQSGGERFASEMDVLLANFESVLDVSEGVVDDAEGTDLTDGPVAVDSRRWKRVGWAVGIMCKHVDGLTIRDGKVVVEGELQERLEELDKRKEEEKRREEQLERIRKEKERREEEEDVASILEAESDDEDPRTRRRLPQTALPTPPSRPAKTRKTGKNTTLNAVPGYTMLVFDTNVLLSSLPLFEKVVEGGQWSVIIPLPVVTELDGLAKNQSPLGQSATAAINYLESRIRTHSLVLKIQTSRGNYLSDLLIRTENVDFSDAALASRNMDDLILNIATFQSEHFVDRSAVLGQQGAQGGETKVLLITFDRNLRLRARARGIDAADEKDMGAILGKV